eukprot:TRINITY_DN5896_c0_g1_i1.p1 TRINITY_DN5896_c0_g1~~TRINITY_DN5896_c0_g1_i1.p1  ORF type:complete len:652 (-),score=122.62 TRINITY_DN5896_c0_g1_i1:1568-3523(-)
MVRIFPFPDINISPPSFLSQNPSVNRFTNRLFIGLEWVDRVFVRPFPAVMDFMSPDHKLAARSMAAVYLVVGIMFLPRFFFTPVAMTSLQFSLPVEICVVVGYFLSRLGWHAIVALATSIVLYCDYILIQISPGAVDPQNHISTIYIPFMLVVVTSHWLVVVIFYIINICLLISVNHGSPHPVSPSQIHLMMIVLTMMLYAASSRYFSQYLLHSQEQGYMKLFRENMTATVIADKKGIIRQTNKSFNGLFSKKDDDRNGFIHANMYDFFEPDQRAVIEDMLSSLLDKKVDDPLPTSEVSCIGPNGEPIPVQVAIKIMPDYKILHYPPEITPLSPPISPLVGREARFSLFSSSAAHQHHHHVQRSDSNNSGSDGLPITSSSEFKLNKNVPANIMFMFFFQDLTAVKKAQAACLEAEREKHANEAKSKFLANMSHEIRTPMNGVLGMLQLLEDTKLNKEQQEFVKNSIDSANLLLTIINDILDFSKIEAGLLLIEEYEFRLSDCVESVVNLLYNSARAKGIDVFSCIHPRCPAIVVGDAARLRQVIMNLVSNAIKFTAKGKVEILCDVDQSDHDDGASSNSNTFQLKFQVHDTGIGLTQEATERLFQRFYQVNGAITRRYGGTGLGLDISRNLVCLIGGEIGVTSKPNDGSTF